MNILLWVLQALAAALYGASGVMKVFMFDKGSEGVASFGALPREAWTDLGILELVCTVGLIVPAAFHWKPMLSASERRGGADRTAIATITHAGRQTCVSSVSSPMFGSREADITSVNRQRLDIDPIRQPRRRPTL